MEAVIKLYIQVILTLLVFSWIYKETFLYRIAEHIFVGVGVGHYFVQAIDNIYKYGILDIMSGNFLSIIAIGIGILYWSRYLKGYTWLERIPVAVLVGFGIGMTMRTVVQANLVNQIRSTILPLLPNTNVTVYKAINNWLVLILAASGLIYLAFTRSEETKTLKIPTTLGRWALLAALGAGFGGAVMGRITMYLDRLIFLLNTFLGL